MIKSVYDLIKPYNNDKLTEFSNKDLYEFISTLKKYYLDLRESLNIADNITFGIEIEVENLKDEFYVLEKDKYFSNWSFSSDDTLLNGREIISPILKDNYFTWQTLANLMKFLGDCSEICSTCGGHIHIGAQILGNNYNYWENLLNFWRAYENIIFRFGYGEFISERLVISGFAEPLIYSDYKVFNKKYRNQALNWSKICDQEDFKDYEYIKNRTFEVRCPNGSLNPIIWQNNINFFVKLFEYVKSNNYEEKFLLKKIECLKSNLKVYDNVLDYYRMIDMENAIELSDLIFDNNLDKIYFLRQYIKNEEVGEKTLEKGKKFTNWTNY